MKQTILVLFFALFFCTTISAQFAVVADEGGFVNVYDDEKEELDRLGADGVVAIEDTDDEWALVDYTKYGDYAASSGYIKKKNLIDITSFQEIPLTIDSTNFVVLSNDSILIRLEVQEFDSTKNSISYFSEDNSQITAINDEAYWGTKTGIPAKQYTAISYKKREEIIEFPEAALFNLFNPHLSLSKAYYDEAKDIIYLLATNGDASGAYTAIWIIEFGEYAMHYIFD